MKKSEAFILPSLWEEVGFVIVEAAISNTFIIKYSFPYKNKDIVKQNGLSLENQNIAAVAISGTLGNMIRLFHFCDFSIEL